MVDLPSIPTQNNGRKTPIFVTLCLPIQVLKNIFTSGVKCDELGNECLSCQCSLDCQYGQPDAQADCTVPKSVICEGNRDFKRNYTCAFCYQTDKDSISCNKNVDCDSVFDQNQRRHYTANCTVDRSTICLGRRDFRTQIPCNWTGGHRWLTALILSITLGGFGADRYVKKKSIAFILTF